MSRNLSLNISNFIYIFPCIMRKRKIIVNIIQIVVIAITGEIKSIRTTSPHPSYKVDTADNQSHRVALGAAAIAILQTALLVLAVGGVCLLARLLRNATCLRDDSDSADKVNRVYYDTFLDIAFFF
jgi:hypothetical protein